MSAPSQSIATAQAGTRTAAIAMFVLLLVAYTLMAADRYLISMLGPDIRDALGLSLRQMGTLTTIFTLGIAIAGLPAGALIAKTSRRTVLLLGIALFSVATLLFTQATGFARPMWISFSCMSPPTRCRPPCCLSCSAPKCP